MCLLKLLNDGKHRVPLKRASFENIIAQREALGCDEEPDDDLRLLGFVVLREASFSQSCFFLIFMERFEVECRHIVEDDGECESITLHGTGDELALQYILVRRESPEFLVDGSPSMHDAEVPAHECDGSEFGGGFQETHDNEVGEYVIEEVRESEGFDRVHEHFVRKEMSCVAEREPVEVDHRGRKGWFGEERQWRLGTLLRNPCVAVPNENLQLVRRVGAAEVLHHHHFA